MTLCVNIASQYILRLEVHLFVTYTYKYKESSLNMWLIHAQVQQTSVDDESIARAIAQKLGDTPGVSYSEVANRAIECGRTELAIRVRTF